MQTISLSFASPLAAGFVVVSLSVCLLFMFSQCLCTLDCDWVLVINQCYKFLGFCLSKMRDIKIKYLCHLLRI